MSTTARHAGGRGAPGREPKPESGLRRTLRCVRPHLKGHRLLMAGGFVALAADVLFRLLEPWPVKLVVDAVSRSLGATLRKPGPSMDASLETLLLCGGAIVVISVVRAIANYWSAIAFALIGSRIAADLRARTFRHVQSLSMRHHTRASSGDTVQRLVGDVSRLQEVAVTAGLPLLGNMVTLVAMTGIMVWLDPLLALVVFFAGGAFVLLSHRSSPSITVAARRSRKGEGALATTAAQTLNAMREVQAYGLEDTISDDFRSSNKQTLGTGVVALRLAAALERRTDVLIGVATAIVLAGGGMRVLDHSITPGDLVVFLTYLKTGMKPLKDLAKQTSRIARATASGERVADLLEAQTDLPEAADACVLSSAHPDIVFDDVTAGHGEGTTVLHGINLSVPAGEHLAILGPSGAGKSTLASLILRMIDPTSGAVLVGGSDLRELKIASVRSHVSILLQDSVLFGTTVRDNIRFGRLDATDEEIENAAALAQADAFIRSLPEGYDTVLGEAAKDLSGGQRQRIAIARAILRQAPIVILDEATAGLDPASRESVLEALAALTRDRTSITITHDEHSARSCDRVIWLEDGRIVEEGRPDELLQDPETRFARWMGDQDPGRPLERLEVP
ncbi:putative ABC transporter ATP-binding protein TM_0288 [Arthrobacter sp. Bi83]|uniref:ABC transporter ATP-binding protein n=1 Tax=Arthrobacter sp. Bi83 TaxID=2822353 RepID=UPI001E09A333|nr:ABC transporter ATP-binding protein [Arthrobacter sp. Bi83]CAH0203975.1 putative ABC transporter ATP-binding protein TM_0288 [Arthrobacter sp. Bi83]